MHVGCDLLLFIYDGGTWTDPYWCYFPDRHGLHARILNIYAKQSTTPAVTPGGLEAVPSDSKAGPKSIFGEAFFQEKTAHIFCQKSDQVIRLWL